MSDDAPLPVTPRLPVATVAIVAVVLVTAGLQAIVPGWYAALARDGLATAPSEWWRVVTALFAYDSGGLQIVSIVVGALLLGIVGEAVFGPRLWVALFMFTGIVGQIVAVFWQPTGAGSSVAVAGQLGAVAAWALLPSTAVPAYARFGPAVVLAGAAMLVFYRDIHGPPVLVGAALGLLLARRRG